VIRPVLEYSALVWHYSLTKEQTHQTEKNTKTCHSDHLHLFSWYAVLFHAIYCKSEHSGQS